VGSTSLLAAAIAVAAMVMLVIGATLTILGAGR
jgi:hypothetical protein